tara:strand:- start:123 stop:260 length:138 start_codon:yes stop_codon:yes gene_type:complete
MALVAHRFGFSWADMQHMKLWELAALMEQIKREQNQQRINERAGR